MEEEKEGEEEKEVVYVAIAKEVKEGRANFEWVLDNISKNKKLVIVHVHRLPHKIPTGLELDLSFSLCFMDHHHRRQKEHLV